MVIQWFALSTLLSYVPIHVTYGQWIIVVSMQMTVWEAAGSSSAALLTANNTKLSNDTFYNRIFGVPLLCGYCSRTSIFTMCLGSASGPFDDVGSNILLSVSFHPFLSPPFFFFFPFLPQCTLLWLAAGVMRVPWWVAAAFSSVIGVSATRLRRAQIRKATLQRVSGRKLI